MHFGRQMQPMPRIHPLTVKRCICSCTVCNCWCWLHCCLLLDVTTTCSLMLYFENLLQQFLLLLSVLFAMLMPPASTTVAACCSHWLIGKFQILSMMSLHPLLLAVCTSKLLHDNSCYQHHPSHLLMMTAFPYWLVPGTVGIIPEYSCIGLSYMSMEHSVSLLAIYIGNIHQQKTPKKFAIWTNTQRCE